MIRLQIAALCFVAGLAIWQAVQGHPSHHAHHICGWAKRATL